MGRTIQRYSVKIGKIKHTSGSKRELANLKARLGAPKAIIRKIKKPYKA